MKENIVENNNNIITRLVKYFKSIIYHSHSLINISYSIISLVSIILCIIFIYKKYSIKNIYYIEELEEHTFKLIYMPVLIIISQIHSLKFVFFSLKPVKNKKKLFFSKTTFSISIEQRLDIDTRIDEIQCTVNKITTEKIIETVTFQNWNFNRLILSNKSDFNKSLLEKMSFFVENQSSILKKILNLIDSHLEASFPIQIRSNILSILISALKYKWLPLNYEMKKENENLNEVVFIIKGCIGGYININNEDGYLSNEDEYNKDNNKDKYISFYPQKKSEKSSHLFFKFNNIYSDKSSQLKKISLKVISNEIEIFSIKENKLYDIFETYRKLGKETETKTGIVSKSSKSNELNETIQEKDINIKVINEEVLELVELIEENSKLAYEKLKDLFKSKKIHINHKKTKSKPVKRRDLLLIRYFFKEDFQNIFHYFSRNILTSNNKPGYYVINMNNYNNYKDINKQNQTDNDNILVYEINN